jgi:glycosyltransferase involved in cell wall biosynthesis
MNPSPNKKIKVLIATGIFPPDIGGPALIAEELAKALQQRGLAVKILTYSRAARQKPDCVAVYRIKKTSRSRWNHLKYFSAMLYFSFWSDINYITDTYSVGYSGFLIKRILKRKYIVRFAGDSAWEKAVNNGWTDDYIVDFQAKTYGPKIENIKKRQKRILANADKVIAVSNFIALIAGKIGARRENIKMIYNSIDFKRAQSIDNALVKKIREKYADKAKLIGTSCRLMPWKGVDGIIRSMPLLLKTFSRINFLVLGDGPQMGYLKKLANDTGVQDRVFFPGIISQDIIANYYQALDLFILNTNYEGLSHTLLEVMQAGTPIIATDSGGNPEVIEDKVNGRLIRYNNEADIREAVSVVLADPETGRQFVSNGYEKLKLFSWDKNIEATVKLITDLFYE